jgi:hypothetical protein
MGVLNPPVFTALISAAIVGIHHGESYRLTMIFRGDQKIISRFRLFSTPNLEESVSKTVYVRPPARNETYHDNRAGTAVIEERQVII